MTGFHTVHEDSPWTERLPDHAARTDTPGFRKSKFLMRSIMATLKTYPFGPGPWQAHHGASRWTLDSKGWFLTLGTVGIEWSAQFCADPAKVDALRQDAARYYAAFPLTMPAMANLGYPEGASILSTVITDAEGVSRWTDSIFNACVPLAAPVHVGILGPGKQLAGAHHYPRPITDIQFIKRDDFTLFVTDPTTQVSMAVVPVAPRGSGDGRVAVAYLQGDTAAAAQMQQEPIILPADHPLAQQAFARQA